MADDQGKDVWAPPGPDVCRSMNAAQRWAVLEQLRPRLAELSAENEQRIAEHDARSKAR